MIYLGKYNLNGRFSDKLSLHYLQKKIKKLIESQEMLSSFIHVMNKRRLPMLQTVVQFIIFQRFKVYLKYY